MSPFYLGLGAITSVAYILYILSSCFNNQSYCLVYPQILAEIQVSLDSPPKVGGKNVLTPKIGHRSGFM